MKPSVQIVGPLAEEQLRAITGGGIEGDFQGHLKWSPPLNPQQSGRTEWPSWITWKARYVIAFAGSRIVGVLSYTRLDRSMASRGTFVIKNYRQKGIARRLWDRTLQGDRIVQVNVGLVSDRGRTLINTLVAAYPRIKWCVEENGGRPSRLLKKRKAA